MAKRNVLTHSKKIKVQSLIQERRLEEARSVCEQLCSSDRLDPEVWILLTTINRRLGHHQEAEANARRALALNPKWDAAHRVLGMALQCQGKLDEAIACYRSALALDAAVAETHYLLANALRESGLIQEAAEEYIKAVELQPDYLEALSNLGAAMTSLNRGQEAIHYLSRALRLRPQAPQVLCNLALVHQFEGRFSEARDHCRLALQYAPDFIDAVALLAELEERDSRLDEARSLAARGLSLASDNISLNLTAARLARRDGRIQEAIELLERVAAKQKSELLGDIYLLLGQLHDRAGNTDRAFACLNEGNRLKARGMIATEAEQQSYLHRIETIRDRFRQSLPETWAPLTDDGNPEDTPVFLIGFPRSGTTLLEQILDSHSKLQALQEKPTVAEMEQEFLTLSQGKPEVLLREIAPEKLRHLRKVYFDSVSKYIKRQPGKALVDKMPLNIVQAYLIWRVFPKAKFILAIRHPCDVCLSCYMQNFALNQAMMTFFSLETTVATYEGVMRLWQEYIRALPIHYHRIRYEDLVANFESETRALLDFLGVGWDEAVLNHVEHAKKRGGINTPSYHQVTQPIYQHAKYRWKRYAKYFEPVLPALQPFIQYFGYAEETGAVAASAVTASTQR